MGLTVQASHTIFLGVVAKGLRESPEVHPPAPKEQPPRALESGRISPAQDKARLIEQRAQSFRFQDRGGSD
jgi:hypothetical protein